MKNSSECQSETARLVNLARRVGGRVIVGWNHCCARLRNGDRCRWTCPSGRRLDDLIVTPERGLRLVNGLLTGFHEPKSSHLAMLTALAGYDHLISVYRGALQSGYLWHEFGDLHLLLPEGVTMTAN